MTTFKTEQFYIPAKFLPPFGVGDRYCFPDGGVWQISGVDIDPLGDEDVKVTVHWCRPLHPTPGWFDEYRDSDTNWFPGAMSNRIWKLCGSNGGNLLLFRDGNEFFIALPDFVDQVESPYVIAGRFARFFIKRAVDQLRDVTRRNKSE